ncbi:MAG: HD domain-containing protein [Chloroflexi bacterium]|nr:HD domain-containing protein [Chloroflexota bacterium]
METNERLQKITRFILERRAATEAKGNGRYPSFDFDYRWKHTLRVTQYGKQIAETEGADVEVVMAACLLHDISKFDDEQYGVEHGRVSARIARPFLETLGYSAEQVDNICFSIAVHVDDKADFEHPVTLESKIVSDADNIDRFGAYRLLLQFKNYAENYHALIEKAESRILTLRKYREGNITGTASGEKLFNHQLDLQINFLEHLINDSKLTIEAKL